MIPRIKDIITILSERETFLLNISIKTRAKPTKDIRKFRKHFISYSLQNYNYFISELSIQFI